MTTEQQSFETIRQWANTPTIARVSSAASPTRRTTAGRVLDILEEMGQTYDAVNTAAKLRCVGSHESNTFLRPFARPGNPAPVLMVYAAEDLLMGLIHPKILNAAVHAAQLEQNVTAFVSTNGHWRCIPEQ